jgi:twitching motility protein PilU
LIRKGDLIKLKSAIEAGTQEGMQTFDQAVYQLYQAGLVSMEDALANADSPNDVKLRMRGLSMGGSS